MKEKEQGLLLQLFHHQNRYMTSKELAEVLSLSERTIRTYIHGLEQITVENGAEMVAKQGHGYQLRLIHPMLFEMFLNKNKVHAKGHCSKNTTINTAFDRQNYILNKLLIEDEHIVLEDLADTFYISRSTLAKDVSSIKEVLKPYGLEMRSKPVYGTWVDGEEAHKRAFMMHYFFKGSRFNSVQEYMSHTSYFDDIPTESFIMVILEECRMNTIKLSDVMIQNVLMHLMLSIKRIEKGLELKRFDVGSAFSECVEYRTAKNIIKRLEEELHIYFPEEEIAYLTLHLGAKNNHSLDEPTLYLDCIERELNEVLLSIERNIGISLTGDNLLKNCLLEHLRPMLIRVHKGMKMENPLANEIMCNHRDIFEITKQQLSLMPSLQDFEVSDDEWAYVTLHFMAAVERVQEQHKLQVLVICSTGLGSAQLLKSRIEKKFREVIHVVSEVGYFEMQEEALKGIDLIISSVNLDSVIFGIPFLHVSVFLSEHDQKSIQDFIDRSLLKKNAIQEAFDKELSSKEKLQVFESYIHQEYFQVFESPVQTKTVINTLINKLSHQEKASYTKHMIDQIHLRESMGSVIFSDSIAVPHPAIPVGNKASIAIGILPMGLRWNEDYQNIKIVFLLSPSCLGNQEIKTMTKTIIRLIDSPELQTRLIECPTFEEFKKIYLSLM